MILGIKSIKIKLLFLTYNIIDYIFSLLYFINCNITSDNFADVGESMVNPPFLLWSRFL